MKNKLILLLSALILISCICMSACNQTSDEKNTTTKTSAPLEVYQDAEGKNFVSLAWKPIKDVDSYNIYIFDETKNDYTLYKETTDCYAAVGELESGKKYNIKVKTEGKNKKECEITAATQPENVNSPEVLQRDINSVYVQWEEVSTADGYDVYIYDDKKSEYTYVTSTNKNVAQLKDLSPASKYKVAVCSYVLSGEYKSKGDLVSLEVHTDCVAPADVKVSDRTTTGYKLSWSKSEGADGYDVCIYDADAKNYYEYKTNLTDTELSVEGLKSGDAKKYMITPYITVNGEKLRSCDSSFIDGVTKLEKVTVSTESILGGVRAKWKKSNNADGYNVYYSYEEDGEYTFAGKTDKNKLVFNVTGIDKEGKCFVKVVPFKTSGNVNFDGEEAVSSGYAYRNDHNEILSSYKQSSSITVTNSDFKVSDYRKNKIMSLINNYASTNKSSFVILDIRSGAMISYNADWYVPTASTVKAPYICYVLSQEIDKGNATIEDILTYEKKFYDPDGSGDIRFHKFGSTYTVKEVIEYILYYSDNCGYLMLQDHFGVENYNKWLESLGCKTFVNGTSMKWGFVSARDSAKIWVEIYKYIETGKYGDFFKNELLTTGYSPIRNNLGYLYKVANKFGGADIGWHDTGIVFKDDNPYIMILLTNDSYEHADYNFQNGMIRQLNALHDELVEFNNQ